MGKSKESLSGSKNKEGAAEKGWRLYKNFNILGALALGGFAIIVPVGGAILAAGAGINVAQAGVGGYMEGRSKKKRLRKPK